MVGQSTMSLASGLATYVGWPVVSSDLHRFFFPTARTSAVEVPARAFEEAREAAEAAEKSRTDGVFVGVEEQQKELGDIVLPGTGRGVMAEW